MGKEHEIDKVTLEDALCGLKAARRFAGEILGFPSSVAVVDQGGFVIAAHSMDGGLPFTMEVAIDKAWTAAILGGPTQMLGRMTDPRQVLMPLDQLPLGQHGWGLFTRYKGRICPIMGGIPIRDKNMAVIGAVGTSGCPSAEEDNRVSQACWSTMYDENPDYVPFEEAEGDVEDNHSLTFPCAMRLTKRAFEEARKQKINISIAVARNSGLFLAVHRMNDTPMGTVEIARDKAWTAATFGIPTPDVSRYGVGKDAGASMNRSGDNERLTTIPGGLPLLRDGKMFGAIGISGGTPEQDLQIARRVIKEF
jgi:uncharacterized protein GlcG (DUF336 family)